MSLLGRKSFNLRYGEGFRKGVTCPNYFLCSMPLRVGGGDKRFFREPEVCFSNFAVQLIDISSYHTRIHLYMTSTAETSNKCYNPYNINLTPLTYKNNFFKRDLYILNLVRISNKGSKYETT